MKKMIMFLVLSVLLPGFMTVTADGGEIKHRFVATDESGNQLIYVDQFDSSNDWSIELKGNRDVHVTEKGTILATVPEGYNEYDLKSGKLIKEVKAGKRIFSMLRLDNGHTILASQNEIFELDANDTQVKTYPAKPGNFFRILRMSKKGNFLYTGSATTVKELSPDGKTVRELEVSKITPKCKKPYLIEELEDGQFLVSAGYGGEVHLVDKNWKLVKTYGVKGKGKGFDIHFASDVQRLKNGNIVLLNWTGHRRKDSENAPQAIEFDKDGKVVWTWHDAKRAGSLHGIVVLEDEKTDSCKSRLVANLESGKQQVVVTYGTSLTSGGAWVGQLQEALDSVYPGKAQVINSGMSGKWSKTGVDNLQTRVIQKKPDTVFIEFAINDAFLRYQTSVEQAKSNLDNMIDRIIGSNPECEIILMTMNPPVGVHLERRPKILEYYQMYRDTAKERKLLLIDHYPNWKKILEDAELFNKYVPDGIHPGPEGCKNVITPGIVTSLGMTAAQKDKGAMLYDGPKDKLHVYLLIGQSNMAGRAKYSEGDSGVIDRAYLLDDKDKWEGAKNPFNRYSTIRKNLGMQKMNPGYSFAKFMTAAKRDVSLGLVVNAKGGTKIEQWAKGTKFYDEAIRRTKIAQQTGVLKGILWHQGESNAADTDYLDKLKTLIENLRADLGIADLPFVAGQVNNVKLVNDQIARLPEVLKYTGFASSEGLKAMDRWHFDTKSMKLLGERYSKEMLRIQSQKKLPAEKPNIVLIFSDDLSYRDLSSYGQKNYSTPNLDRLAFSGMRFVNAFCGSSECAPSRGSLMTGMHMGHCRIRKNRSVRGQDHLLDKDVTIAEVLKMGGYATGFIGKWGIGLPGTEGTPDKQGFDLAYGYYDQLRAHTFFPYYMMRNGKAEALPGNYGFDLSRRYRHSGDKTGKYDNKYDDMGRLVVEELKDPAKAVYSEDLFRKEAVGFIKTNKDKPFFLYYATQLPHGPCIASDISKFKDKPWDQKHKEWAAMVEYMDGSVGMIVKALEETEQMENTLILFAGDNGYSQWGYFGRKAHEDDPVFNNKGPWPKGKFTCTHEGGVRVPFFAYWKGKIKATESEHMCALYDILATASDLAGIEAPKTDGISMVPTLFGNDSMQQKHDYFYWENGGKSTNAQSVRMGKWWAYRSHPSKPLELYDVTKDVDCKNDAAGENPGVAQKVLQIFKEAHVDSDWYNNPGESQAVLNSKKKKAEATDHLQVPVRGNSNKEG